MGVQALDEGLGLLDRMRGLAGDRITLGDGCERRAIPASRRCSDLRNGALTAARSALILAPFRGEPRVWG